MFHFSPNLHMQDPRWQSCSAISELALARLHRELQHRDIFWGCEGDRMSDDSDSVLEYAIVLTDDTEIQRFNREFREKDTPTNVLSFPSDETGELGDIILSYDTIVREAAEQQKTLEHHVTHMLLHGLLHLLGFDHEEDEEAEEMEAVEIDVLSCLSVKNPYA